MTFALQLIHLLKGKRKVEWSPLSQVSTGLKEFLLQGSLPACGAGKQNGLKQLWCSSPSFYCYFMQVYCQSEVYFNNTSSVGIKPIRNKPTTKTHFTFSGVRATCFAPQSTAPMSATHLSPRSSEPQHISEPFLHRLLNTETILSPQVTRTLCNLQPSHRPHSKFTHFTASSRGGFMLLNISQECHRLNQLSQWQQ